MSENEAQSTFWRELGDELRAIPNGLRDGWNRIAVDIQNGLIGARNIRFDYVAVRIGGPLPERSAPPRSFVQRQLPLPPEPLSIQTVNRRLQAIGDADNVHGALLIFTGLSVFSFGKLERLRRAIERLKGSGKDVVVYTPYLDLPHYYVATAADAIIAPPSSDFEVLGLTAEQIFLKDTLEKVGLKMDLIQISPYKASLDPLAKSEMSPELEEMTTWMLDDNYERLVNAIATGRRLTVAAVRNLIDRAPFFAAEAQAHGLLDHVAYEDDLRFVLAGRATETRADGGPPTAETTDDDQPPTAEKRTTDGQPPTAEDPDENTSSGGEAASGGPRSAVGGQGSKASLIRWSDAQGQLTRRFRRWTEKAVGVITIEGTIVRGASSTPPIDLPLPIIGGTQAGAQTINQQLRRAERRNDLGALLLYVNSPGGDALASDLIAREVQRVARKLPVVVLMGNVAASGGYYISAPAAHIMAQEGTVTGSIGVFAGRLATQELLERAAANRILLQRGARAGLYGDGTPLTAEEYQILYDYIGEVYRQFKQIVADERELDFDALDEICNGRVWTGRQARDHGLVDSFGDFQDAIDLAAEMGGIPVDDEHEIPLVIFRGGGTQLPKPFEPSANGVRLAVQEHLRGWNGRAQLLMPYTFRFW